MMLFRTLAALALALGGAVCRAAALPNPAASDLAITPVAVVDVERGRLPSDQTVLIRGNRIVAVQPADAAAVPAGARVLDGRGRFLIPGLWDLHAHLPGSGRPTEIEVPLLLAHGVTGVRILAAAERQ